ELLDADSTAVLNRGVPLAMVRDASRSKELPASLRRGIALAAFTRALILEEDDVAIDLVPEMKQYDPKATELFDRYRTASAGAERRFAAAYMMLQNPGFNPLVSIGLDRRDHTPLKDMDLFRQNWWCEAQKDQKAIEVSYLTAQQRQDFDSEWRTYGSVSAAP